MEVYCNGRIAVGNIKVADTFLSRLIGLMGKKDMDSQEGLLLLNCPSVHCFFMRFPIDVVYLTKDMKVLALETLAPWKLGRRVKKTAHVLELKAGFAQEKLSTGDKLEIL